MFLLIKGGTIVTTKRNLQKADIPFCKDNKIGRDFGDIGRTTRRRWKSLMLPANSSLPGGWSTTLTCNTFYAPLRRIDFAFPGTAAALAGGHGERKKKRGGKEKKGEEKKKKKKKGPKNPPAGRRKRREKKKKNKPLIIDFVIPTQQSPLKCLSSNGVNCEKKPTRITAFQCSDTWWEWHCCRRNEHPGQRNHGVNMLLALLWRIRKCIMANANDILVASSQNV